MFVLMNDVEMDTKKYIQIYKNTYEKWNKI